MTNPHAGGKQGGHEERDVSLKGPVIFGAIIIAGIMVSLFLMTLVFNKFAEREAREQVPMTPLELKAGESQPPEPRLEMDPVAEFHKIRDQEEATLHGYGWVDEKAGIAHIPIERAMDMVLEKGLPAREGLADEGLANEGGEETAR